MDTKFLGDFRRPRLSADDEARHQLFRDTASLIREKTDRMKEAIIRQVLGNDALDDPELRGRMRMEVHPHGTEKVFLDDELLVEFFGGQLDLKSGEWKVQYRVPGARP